jgi:hypothetical protein
MSLNYFYPFLGYGLIHLGASGNPALLLISLVTLLIWWTNQERRKIDLQAEVRFHGGRVWVGQHRLGLFPPLWGTELRNLVYAAAFEPDPLEGIDPDRYFEEQMGVTRDGHPVPQPISQIHPHAIVIGPTGSGKTELAKLIADQHGGELWVVDFSGGAGFITFPRVRSLITPMDLRALPELRDRLLDRSETKVNRKLLLVVEGLADAMSVPELERLIHRVVTTGRSSNSMLLATNQTLSSVPRHIWVNCFNRISVGADSVDRVQLGFSGTSPRSFSNLLPAQLLQGSTQTTFGFPIGLTHEKTVSETSETVNPFLIRALPRLL